MELKIPLFIWEINFLSFFDLSIKDIAFELISNNFNSLFCFSSFTPIIGSISYNISLSENLYFLYKLITSSKYNFA